MSEEDPQNQNQSGQQTDQSGQHGANPQESANQSDGNSGGAGQQNSQDGANSEDINELIKNIYKEVEEEEQQQRNAQQQDQEQKMKSMIKETVREFKSTRDELNKTIEQQQQEITDLKEKISSQPDSTKANGVQQDNPGSEEGIDPNDDKQIEQVLRQKYGF